MSHRIIVLVLALSKSLRITLLSSVFGFVSHCKHYPTCGDYCVQMIEEKGLVKGLPVGLKRLICCW